MSAAVPVIVARVDMKQMKRLPLFVLPDNLFTYLVDYPTIGVCVIALSHNRKVNVNRIAILRMQFRNVWTFRTVFLQNRPNGFVFTYRVVQKEKTTELSENTIVLTAERTGRVYAALELLSATSTVPLMLV